VIIGRNLKIDSCSSIEIDNKAGTREALRYLFTLGHRRIALIKGPGMLTDTAERWSDIYSFAEEVGLTLHPDLIVHLKKPTHSYVPSDPAITALASRPSPLLWPSMTSPLFAR
jgi:DNA-binding LacI/PurR family transcriptional regulator